MHMPTRVDTSSDFSREQIQTSPNSCLVAAAAEQAVQKTFGYPKTELEGANVSMLMPQPFSQRHDSYLARYVSTAESRILDSVREVVALHKVGLI